MIGPPSPAHDSVLSRNPEADEMAPYDKDHPELEFYHLDLLEQLDTAARGHKFGTEMGVSASVFEISGKEGPVLVPPQDEDAESVRDKIEVRLYT